MSSVRVTTNFKDNNGTDLGDKLVTKDYLISVYPEIGDKIGIPPELWTWGFGTLGQLGNASTTDRSTPVTTFAGGSSWKQVSIASRTNNYITAIKTDGTLWTWGAGSNGVLGNANTSNRSTPVTTFAGGNNWKQVSSGGNHTAAIKTDGTLWVWGIQASGRLGNGVTFFTSISTPVTTFAGGTNWKQVTAGYAHVAAIKTDGTLWTWGAGSNGRLGNGVTAFTSISTPVTTFAGGTDWKQVSCGGSHTTAIKTDGTLWTWGTGSGGRLGNNATTNVSTPVTTFSGGTNWKQVSCGYVYTAAIKTDGTLWTWGTSFGGRLGDGRTANFTIPTPITTFAGGTNWKQVSAGRDHAAAIKTDGTIWIWGLGDNGRLGTNDTTTRSTPVTTFAGGTNWKQVTAGELHSAAIQSVDF